MSHDALSSKLPFKPTPPGVLRQFVRCEEPRWASPGGAYYGVVTRRIGNTHPRSINLLGDVVQKVHFTRNALFDRLITCGLLKHFSKALGFSA